MSAPEYTVRAFHDPCLPAGGREFDAVLTVTAQTGGRGAAPAAHVIMVDCSGSMRLPTTKIAEVRRAAAAAFRSLPDGALFAVIAGRHHATMAYPADEQLVEVSPTTRAEAIVAMSRLEPSGGTAIGTWLALARRLLSVHHGRIRHGLLLTDGHNEHETPGGLGATLSRCAGIFTCDCRGVGSEWNVAELRTIASHLLGSVDIVADPAGLAADFQQAIRQATTKAVDGVALRLWTPYGAAVHAVKQVAPTVEDLTHRPAPVDPSDGRIGYYPTGAWGNESRDYHLRLVLNPREVGEQIQAARVSMVRFDRGRPRALGDEARLVVKWVPETMVSGDASVEVANAARQAELSQAIREGLEARRAGDADLATTRLGRAVALAAESGHEETTELLGKLVEVVDAADARIRLRADVPAEDVMTLDVRSTRSVPAALAGWPPRSHRPGCTTSGTGRSLSDSWLPEPSRESSGDPDRH